LALEKSSEKRVELLKRVTDAYLDRPDDHSAAEQYLLNEIVANLVGKISGSARIEASVGLSKLPLLPPDVARSLATDSDISVAGPIVRDYRGLSDQILIEVAQNGSQDHLHAIAGRPVVSPPVTDVVVTRGDQRTARTLAANKGAQFSSDGMQALISKAAQDVGLQALIVERADLAAEAIERLLPMMSRDLAARLREKAIDLDELVVSEHLAGWMNGRKDNIATTDGFIDSIRKGRLQLDQVVIDLIDRNRLFDAATVIAAIVDLDRYHGFNILTSGKTHAVLLLLKSLELPWAVVEAFLSLRQTKMGADGPVGSGDSVVHAAMDAATAQRAIRFIKVRPAAMRPSGNASAPDTSV